ncbi:NAD(P)H-dependent oxidoreductase [Novosphingobium guangzhouense]|uniref:NAD(P)-dependent oxidoreductase n=1 Tax=Novosphingobium guangzhouense TaxID=1850347 RepID=A0A2K2G190_9SPHN|nr:Gfo/Idh/MocA family oxidoreductase [Novosphingobium guangzhouense]PNU04764.1 NAD(P)-dependent oxidoreductase [Novosphingobium guangzhouense]
MILVDTALAACEAEGRQIRVAVIGAGFQGAAIVRQIVRSTPGMKVVGVANRHPEKAWQALADAGCEPVMTAGLRNIERAIAAGTPVATDDVFELAAADGVDVVVEVTGSVDYAAGAVLAAIAAGKHVVHMNAELDGTVGPILKVHADRAGVLYTFSDGDQPGVQMNLVRTVRGLGVTPRLAGNIKGLHDPYRNPETQAAFAARWGQKPAMVASFADGTKISFEQAIVANGCDFRVARRGMIGPDFSGGDPTAPLVPLEETIHAFAQALDAAGAGDGAKAGDGGNSGAGSGLVDYVVGARPGPGVFVLGTHDDPRQQHFLDLYKLGKGPYYCFYTPYHLCHFEVPNSIARAALFGDPVLTPMGGPKVGVIALAKQDLAAGDLIADFGGFEVYGVAENHDVIEAAGLLPVGLALGTRLRRPVPRDTPLTFDDVVFPPDRLIDRLYAQQREHFPSRPELVESTP